MCFINSGFLCQSAPYKKFPAKMKILGILVISANLMTLGISPKLIKHFIAITWSGIKV